MITIFFDLETSDINFTGQILNYAFVEVDSEWNMRSCLRDKVKISPLQLPTPEAILANKIDVLEHQKEAKDNELQAMRRIYNYLQSFTEHDTVRLIGYNSNSFDVHYLRTSFIRNGLNPYFGGQLSYGDVFHVVTKLSVSNESFLSILPKKESGKPSTSLESVGKSLKLLDESAVQEHESMSDALLTIELAKALLNDYAIDVRTYNSYEITKRYTDFDAVEVYPYFDDSGKLVSDDNCILTVHAHNKNTTLWINLKKFEDVPDRSCMLWRNKNTSPFFVKRYIKDADIRHKCDDARDKLSDVTIDNFWPEKYCDIEQSIYSLPINEIKSLTQAIHDRDLYLLKENKNKHANVLYLRFLCSNVDSEEVSSIATKYILHRYGGKMRIDKSASTDGAVYHPTYKELLSRIDKYSEGDSESLMRSLREFYTNSKVAKVFAENL